MWVMAVNAYCFIEVSTNKLDAAFPLPIQAFSEITHSPECQVSYLH